MPLVKKTPVNLNPDVPRRVRLERALHSHLDDDQFEALEDDLSRRLEEIKQDLETVR